MVKASEIMQRAGILLTDEDAIRWPLPERAMWINEAVSAIVTAKPSAATETRVVNLAVGTKQEVPTDGPRKPVMLMRAIRNILPDGKPGRAISPIDIVAMNAIEPDWHSERRTRQQADHYIYDEQNPEEYFVYPANNGTGKLELLLACIPEPIKASGNENEIESYDQDIGLIQGYDVAVLDYLIYRAQSKDATGGSADLAMAHYNLFAQAVGLKAQVEAVNSPNARRSA